MSPHRRKRPPGTQDGQELITNVRENNSTPLGVGVRATVLSLMQDEPEGKNPHAGDDHQHARRKGICLEEIQAFWEASEEVCFQAQDRGELYGWVKQSLRQQDCGRLKRRGRGLVRKYLAKMTGLSRAQVLD
jgi:hypothetical protein